MTGLGFPPVKVIPPEAAVSYASLHNETQGGQQAC